jgi:hypothetical protein
MLLKKRKSARLGVAAVELAFLAPLLGFIFVIGLDWARVFYYSVTINDCARNGAAYESDIVGKGMSQYATCTDAALAGTNLSPTPTVTPTSGSDANGAYVEVTVSYQFKTITAFPGVPSDMNVQKTVRMYNAAKLPNVVN